VTENPASGSLTVLTPSYAPDLELCRDLNRSIMDCGEDDVEHHIIVPARDRSRFSPLTGARTVIHDVADFLPGHLLKVPGANMWANLRRPFPPIRGWIAQQLVKLSAAAKSESEAVLLVDSDMVFVRPFGASTFSKQGNPAFYRNPGAVHAGLPRHRQWHEVSRKILGLEPPASGALTDYICWPCLWQPTVVRRMLAAVESRSGKDWATELGGQLHFSEMVLYGVFVDDVMGGSPSATNRTPSAIYSEEKPLDEGGLDRFLGTVRDEDVAVMISAKSGTDIEARRSALARHVFGPEDTHRGDPHELSG
jgi:hypothetical protein